MRPLLVDQFNRPVLRASGGYEGAMMQRRLRAFVPSRQSINSLLSHAGDNLVARSHYVVRNNPYARNAKRSFKANLVGMGIKPYSQVQDRELRQNIHTLWNCWLNEADADGTTSFYGLQTMIAAALWESGECFVRIRPRRISDGLSVPLQLQLVESEQLPLYKNELARNGNEIRSGIEFNRIGRRVAYHFLRQHPGDNLIRQQPREFTRVPGDQVLHIYEAQRPGQIRGEPQTAASLVRMFLLDQYDDAELDRKKVAALFAAFITSPSPDMPALPGQEATSEDGVVIAGLEPGIIQRLDAGEDIRFSEPSEVGGSYESFQYRNLLAIAAGMGVPYQNVSGDFGKANYSSLRAALLEFRAWMQQLQHCTLIFQFCRPVWRRWVTDAVLSGALDIPGFAENPDEFLSAKWIPPAWPWVDPLKDGQAELLHVRAGFKSRIDTVNERGSDIEEVDEEISAGNKSADDRGLVLDSDPRRVSKTGVSQTNDPIPDDEDETNREVA